MSKKPTFQEQVHFMSCQADMLDEQGNDISAEVMRDATKVLVDEHQRAGKLEAKLRAANERMDRLVDTQIALLKHELSKLKSAQPEAAPTRDEVLEDALKDIADGPQPIESYKQGIRCGLEDRDLQAAGEYAAAEYGYEQGLDWCADIAARALKIAAPQGAVTEPCSTPSSVPSAVAATVVPRERRQLALLLAHISRDGEIIPSRSFWLELVEQSRSVLAAAPDVTKDKRGDKGPGG